VERWRRRKMVGGGGMDLYGTVRGGGCGGGGEE
jgi:hypothetical protein